MCERKYWKSLYVLYVKLRYIYKKNLSGFCYEEDEIFSCGVKRCVKKTLCTLVSCILNNFMQNSGIHQKNLSSSYYDKGWN